MGYKETMSAIRTASIADIENLYSLTSDENHITEKDYFERALAEQDQGSREIIIIEDDNKLAGYCQYQRRPQYQPFRSMDIPEIQDLYIHPDHRQKGLATALVEFCCRKAKEEQAHIIGIGVGLYKNYGKAQKLYVKLGFEPDGGGIVYERKPVMPGKACRIDDELCLMMIKTLD